VAINSLLFKQLPIKIIIKAVYNSFFWLNAIPSGIAYHGTVSQRIIVTGIKNDVKKHFKAEFGS